MTLRLQLRARARAMLPSRYRSEGGCATALPSKDMSMSVYVIPYLICSVSERWDASEAQCIQKASDLCHSRQEVTMLETLTARTPTQWTLPIDALQ